MNCGETAEALREHTRVVEEMLPNAEQRMTDIEQQFAGMEEGIKASFPIAPNLLADTYQFSTLCGGQVNTPMHILDAHTDSLFSSFFYGGSEGSGTIEVLTLDKIQHHGLEFGGDLELATDALFTGSDFRVVMFDVTLTKDMDSGLAAQLNVLNSGCAVQTGWSKGLVKTEAQAMINVISQEGDIHFKPLRNMSSDISANATDVGLGWQFKHSVRSGFSGCPSGYFKGIGSMKVALALPYVGTGDHGGNFFWADAIKSPADAQNNNYRYTHKMN